MFFLIKGAVDLLINDDDVLSFHKGETHGLTKQLCNSYDFKSNNNIYMTVYSHLDLYLTILSAFKLVFSLIEHIMQLFQFTTHT